jgi:hypothetical protein
VPEGWKLVPVEPTAQMLIAGQQAWLDDPMRRSSTLYSAMLSASPPPPQSDEIGLNWQISDEARRQIDEIERNQRNAMLNARNIVAGSSAQSDEIETLRARVKELEQDKRAANAFWKAMARRFADARRSAQARAESAERKLSELTQR